MFQEWYQQALQTAHHADKKLGQHFIYDFGLLQKIASAADLKRAPVIFEIGAGLGGLTASMLDLGASKIIAIEKDKNLAEKLQPLATLAKGRLEIICGDARTDSMDFDGKGQGVKATIIANLPYNVGTHLLGRYLDDAPHYHEMVLMFQREVGCRLTAKPDSGEYGRLSILGQARAEIKTAMTLPPGAFRPQPKISSSVLKFTLRDAPNLDYPNLKKLTSLLFTHRRKKIQKILTAHGIARELWHETRAPAPIDGNRRPDTLTVAEAIALSAWVSARLG